MYCLDRISWIVSAGLYQLDRISIGLGLARRNSLVCNGLFSTGWMGRMDWTGCWWDASGVEGPALAGAGTVAPTLALERERRHWILSGGGRWEVAAGTNCVGAARACSICVIATK